MSACKLDDQRIQSIRLLILTLLHIALRNILELTTYCGIHSHPDIV